MKTKAVIAFIVVVVGFLIVTLLIAKDIKSPKTIQGRVISAKISSADITLEIADSPQERTQGLSGRKSLAPDRGVLFIFQNPGLYNFWMKDMHFPIDIFWVDATHRIVSIDKNILPETYPDTFAPTSPVLYVIETNAGFADRFLINPGDSVQLSGGWPN